MTSLLSSNSRRFNANLSSAHPLTNPFVREDDDPWDANISSEDLNPAVESSKNLVRHRSRSVSASRKPSVVDPGPVLPEHAAEHAVAEMTDERLGSEATLFDYGNPFAPRDGLDLALEPRKTSALHKKQTGALPDLVLDGFMSLNDEGDKIYSSTSPIIKTDSVAESNIPLDCPLGLRHRERTERIRDDHPHDAELTWQAQLTSEEREAEARKDVIIKNATIMRNRRKYLEVLSKALLVFAAPAHRVVTQLDYAAKVLEVNAQFVHVPGVVFISYVQETIKTTRTETIQGAGQLELGRLRQVESIYNAVVQDKYSAIRGADFLEALMDSRPIYPGWARCVMAFMLSALICPLAFAGSFLDIWLAGVLGLLLCVVQVLATSAGPAYGHLIDIITVTFLSLAARLLASLDSGLFCYTATASSAVVSLLPGYLILTSTFEIGSGNIICGSFKIVYALTFTLFLGFSLQTGSDLYLAFNEKAFEAVAAGITGTVVLKGIFTTDNATQNFLPPVSTFTFTKTSTLQHQVLSCYRPPGDPWYLRTVPDWTQFFIVPMFAFVCSLCNFQPASCRSSRIDLAVMTIIGCASYTTNTLVNIYFGYAPLMSTVGAFTVAFMGNGWARATGRSAFGAMVTGVLFLVPNGLSQNGGITTNGNGVIIGENILSVSISIGVGLFIGHIFSFIIGKKDVGHGFSF